MFDADKRVMSRAHTDKFIKFYLDGGAIAILKFWIKKTIRNVTIVVPVLMINCHVSEYRNMGPVIAQTSTIIAASKNVNARPAA